MLVYVCPAGSESEVETPQGEYPACQSGGEWVEHVPSIWRQPIERESFDDLLSSTAAVLIVAVSIRMVLNVIRNRR